LEPTKPLLSVLRAEGFLAVTAGSDTTATAITALLHYLILDPPKLDRLRNEVDAFFRPGEEPIDFAKMANMPYLNACMSVFASVMIAALSVGRQYADLLLLTVTKLFALFLPSPVALKGLLSLVQEEKWPVPSKYLYLTVDEQLKMTNMNAR
jgi:hypothetical protein